MRRILPAAGSLLSAAHFTAFFGNCQKEQNQHPLPEQVSVYFTPQSKSFLGKHFERIGIPNLDNSMKSDKIIFQLLANERERYFYEPLYGRKIAFRLKGFLATESGTIMGMGRLSSFGGVLRDTFEPCMPIYRDLKSEDHIHLPTKAIKLGLDLNTSDRWTGLIDDEKVTYYPVPFKDQLLLEAEVCCSSMVNPEGQCLFGLNKEIEKEAKKLENPPSPSEPPVASSSSSSVTPDVVSSSSSSSNTSSSISPEHEKKTEKENEMKKNENNESSGTEKQEKENEEKETNKEDDSSYECPICTYAKKGSCKYYVERLFEGKSETDTTSSPPTSSSSSSSTTTTEQQKQEGSEGNSSSGVKKGESEGSGEKEEDELSRLQLSLWDCMSKDEHYDPLIVYLRSTYSRTNPNPQEKQEEEKNINNNNNNLNNNI